MNRGLNFSSYVMTGFLLLQYKPDGFNPFCHDYVHIVYVYTPTALFALFMYILCICYHGK